MERGQNRVKPRGPISTGIDYMNLAGKDYFTIDDAAAYAGVSLSQWKKEVKNYNIRSFKFMGKRLYRKADLVRLLENAWQQSHGEAKTTPPPPSTGAKKASATALASARSRATRPKQSDWKKRCNYAQAQARE